MTRRELIEAVRGLLAALAAIAAAPAVSFFWAASRVRDPPGRAWSDLGPAGKVEDGAWQRRTLRLERNDRWRQEGQEEVVYLRRRDDAFEAVSAICPHTGCLVRQQSDGFTCPCHKSRFDAEGRPLEGPSPRALDRLECKVERGRLHVKYLRYRPGTRAREPLDG